jgi:hypothetical protein
MTLDEAKRLQYGDHFHEDECVLNVGKRGGVTFQVTEWRLNGQVRTWKRDPSRVEIPAKYGMRSYFTFTERHLDSIHLPADCPLAGLKLYGPAEVEATHAESSA